MVYSIFIVTALPVMSLFCFVGNFITTISKIHSEIYSSVLTIRGFLLCGVIQESTCTERVYLHVQLSGNSQYLR